MKEKILAARKMTNNGNVVSYDLTFDVDFLNPKETAEALADVFFEKDAIYWFNEDSSGDLELKPNRRAVIRARKSDMRKVKKVLSHLGKRVKNTEFKKFFAKNIRDSSHYNPNPVEGEGTITSAISTVLDRRRYKSDLAEDLMKQVSVEYID